MSAALYEVYAIKYATREGMRGGNFIGGDPLVMQRYPAPSKDLDGIVVRLDVAPY